MTAPHQAGGPDWGHLSEESRRAAERARKAIGIDDDDELPLGVVLRIRSAALLLRGAVTHLQRLSADGGPDLLGPADDLAKCIQRLDELGGYDR